MQSPHFFPDASGYLIHERQIAQFGGADGVRDGGLLSSAMHKPQFLYKYDPDNADIAAYAANYAVGISQNHPFIDGNKRTAAVVCEAFLRDNGYSLSATDDEWYGAIIRVATGEWNAESLAEWLRDRLNRRNS